MNRRLLPGLVIAGGLLLTGCSQINALQPVSGGPITTVRNATYVVLVDQQVPIKVAPVCEEAADAFLCIGSTLDGSEITVTAKVAAPYELTIEVGGEVIFTGSAEEVLSDALLEES